jgi:hypothetical protein
VKKCKNITGVSVEYYKVLLEFYRLAVVFYGVAVEHYRAVGSVGQCPHCNRQVVVIYSYEDKMYKSR